MDELEKEMSENYMNFSFEELESSLISMCEGDDCHYNSLYKENYNNDSFFKDDYFGDIFVKDCNNDNFCEECHCENCKKQDVSLLTKLIDRKAKNSCNCIDDGDSLIQHILHCKKGSTEDDKALKSTASSFAKWISETFRFKPQITNNRNSGITGTSSKNLKLDNDCHTHNIQFNSSDCSIVKSSKRKKPFNILRNTSEKNRKRSNRNKGLKDSFKENLQKYPEQWLDIPKMPKKNFIETCNSKIDLNDIARSDDEDKLWESDMELSSDVPDDAMQIICEENHNFETSLNEALIEAFTENNSGDSSIVSHSEALLSEVNFQIDEANFKHSTPDNCLNKIQEAKVGFAVAQIISPVQNYDKQNVKTKSAVTEAVPDLHPVSEILDTNSSNTENVSAPFKSKDPQENKDIENPEWDQIRELKTDEERYRKVQSLWKNVSVPNPNRDLTFHSFRKKRLQKALFIKGKVEKSVRKRERTNDDVVLPLKRSRTKTKSCTDLFDEKIQEHQEQLAWQNRKILTEMKKSEDILENQLHFKRDEITRAYKIQMAQYSRRYPNDRFQQLYWTLNKNLADLGTWQDMQRQNLYSRHNQQIHAIKTEVERILENLSEARQEVLNFNKFYLGLSSDEDTTLLTDSQLQEIQETERTYKLYNVLYACTTFM
ncbi:uncharacterized protein LOC143247704 [Tachypleus tridentatus]|uniref:uncharacterized protein LOC143247704 n=1 Tax=Tachypleus tridentatus TaxID=6853 RepID=UPI003FD386E8